MGGAGAGPSDWPCNPCIHWPSHSVACLVHTLICIQRQLFAKCWPVFTWNISLCQSCICLKAEVPLAPVSQSIVSKYQSNIHYLKSLIPDTEIVVTVVPSNYLLLNFVPTFHQIVISTPVTAIFVTCYHNQGHRIF